VRREKKKRRRRLIKSLGFSFFFFFFLCLCGSVRGGAGTRRGKMSIPATRPAPHGLDIIQPESVQKHSKSERIGADRGGSVRFCGLGGFLPSPKYT
jgi:hypothetical protein